MAEEANAIICLCPNCFTPATQPGQCVECGHELLVCRPGDPDDPCRRPLLSAHGDVLTQAPRWWLKYTVGNLAELTAKHTRV